jgi:hypothetical protein
MNTVSRILAGLLTVAVCGCSEHESCQGLAFASAEELNVFQKELVTLGFRGGGHADGVMTDAQGIGYAVAGYGNAGEYEGLKTGVAIRIFTPSDASRQPIERSALIRCWSRSKTKADATSLRLKHEIERRVKEKMANQGMEHTPRKGSP